MVVIDGGRMYWEMKNTMKCNFQGTPEYRYQKAKELFFEGVEEIIEANKEELLKEVEE